VAGSAASDTALRPGTALRIEELPPAGTASGLMTINLGENLPGGLVEALAKLGSAMRRAQGQMDSI
jgi:hypothetical protein